MRLLTTGLIALGISIGLTGCGSSPPSRFYLLKPLSRTASTQSEAALKLGVGPIALAKYLNRPQIVVRTGAHRLELAEYDRWAEPLEDNMARVLAENLAATSAVSPVVISSWMRGAGVEYRLLVDVVRFDVEEEGRAVLAVNWGIGASESVENPRLGPFSYRTTEACDPDDFESQVAALSRTLRSFSQEVAGRLGSLK